MKVRMEDRPEVFGVLVDGKAVAGAVAFDLEAGYVELELPTVPKIESEGTGSFEVDDEEVTWTTTQKFGKIQLIVARKQ